LTGQTERETAVETIGFEKPSHEMYKKLEALCPDKESEKTLKWLCDLEEKTF